MKEEKKFTKEIIDGKRLLDPFASAPRSLLVMMIVVTVKLIVIAIKIVVVIVKMFVVEMFAAIVSRLQNIYHHLSSSLI